MLRMKIHWSWSRELLNVKMLCQQENLCNLFIPSFSILYTHRFLDLSREGNISHFAMWLILLLHSLFHSFLSSLSHVSVLSPRWLVSSLIPSPRVLFLWATVYFYLPCTETSNSSFCLMLPPSLHHLFTSTPSYTRPLPLPCWIYPRPHSYSTLVFLKVDIPIITFKIF